MNVADSGEEMVLKVKVQSTKRPAQKQVLAVNTKSNLRLMNRPRRFNVPVFRKREVCLSRAVGKLKDH